MTSPHSGETFKNERALCLLIPPAPSNRGRPNASGHIHRTTLRSSLDRLEAAGIFTSWKTLGKRIAVSDWRTRWGRGGRTPAIRVWRLNRTAWARAWGTLKQTALRILYQVRAAACPGDERGSSWQSRAPFWADNQPSHRSRNRNRTRFRKWVEAGTPVEAIEKIWGHADALEFEAYLTRSAMRAGAA
jgi:hypothetical protein